MKSARDILSELRIIERPGRGGSFYTTCPECSHLRRGLNKKSACLRVTVDQDGILFFCNHCPNRGGQFYDGKARAEPSRPKAPAKPKRPIESYYR